MKPTDSSVLDEGHAGQRKYIGTLSNKFGSTMPHYMPHLHYPEKEPLVIKLYRKLDLNGYEEDRKIRSTVGATITILIFVLMWFSINSSFVLMERRASSQAVHQHGRSKIPAKLPELGVSFSRIEDFDETWGRVVFKLRTIYESDKNEAKPRKNRKLGTEQCKIETHPGIFVNAYCPKDKDDLTVVGEYASKVYRYMKITVEPCWNYEQEVNEKGLSCQNRTDIIHKFLRSYGGISVWINDRISYNETAWGSKAYTTFEDGTWQGIEVFFKPVTYTLYGIFTGFFGLDGVSKQLHYLEFESFYTRRSSDISEEFLNYYLRMSDKSQVIDETLYGLQALVERIGGTFGMLKLTLGAFALVINMLIVNRNNKKITKRLSVVQPGS